MLTPDRLSFHHLITLSLISSSSSAFLPANRLQTTTFLPSSSFSLEDPLAALKALPTFDWSTLPSSPHLSYTTCYNAKFHCAYLTVPLDWTNQSNLNNVSLPIIRLPASVPPSDPEHGGTIIVNPGGPGGPGTLWALESAEKLQRKLQGGKNGEGLQYDILSFDPRGIFNSRPNSYCYSSPIEAEIWLDEKEAAGGLANEYGLKFSWAAERARAELCAEKELGEGRGVYADGENLRKYVGTMSVVRDLLEIVERVDEHAFGGQSGAMRERGEECQNVWGVGAGMEEERKKPKLRYLGTSYGTFIGQMFAAIYPDRVDKMILDANLDAENWISRYEASIDDHASIRDYFFETCYQNKNTCAFFRSSDTSPSDLKTRFETLLSNITASPQFYISSSSGRASPLTARDINQGFLTTTYQPLAFFPLFATFLSSLVDRNNTGTPFWQRATPTRETLTNPVLAFQYYDEVSPAVHCADGPAPFEGGTEIQFEEFKKYLTNLTERFGPDIAALQADFKLPCWVWPSSLRPSPTNHFTGPFTGDVPILFLNNRLDPATPAKSARKMAKAYQGSVFLKQDAVGHGVLGQAGECVWDAVRDYLERGEMPQEGKVCEPRCVPFGECEDEEN